MSALGRAVPQAMRACEPARALEKVIPTPGLLEIDEIDLALPVAEAWQIVRHADFAELPLVRALFALRAVPERLALPIDEPVPPVRLCLDDLRSTPGEPGFQILADDGPHEVVVGAIGKVWHLTIPFVHVNDAEAFAAFQEPGFVKVAWAMQLTPRLDGGTHLVVELRVDATDPVSWRRFRRYFGIIGGPSRFIRRSMLADLAKRYGTPESKENVRPLPGDDLLGDAVAQITQGIDVAAPPEAIWPWLLQMGAGRAGFYSIDAVDNSGARSAREIHPELQRLRVGDVVPAGEQGDGFEVLAIDPDRALVLGGLWDVDGKRQLPFATTRPERFWQVTWTFVLQPIDPSRTRVSVRARASFPKSGRIHATWIRPVHRAMEATQLRHLAARVEGRLPADDWRDVAEGIGGAGVMLAAFLTPFLRDARCHWGVDATTLARHYPGDELVREPRWSWTHGIEIDAAAADVWPWVAQLGADRGGFYSYQWLENLAGCRLRNAEAIHPELALHEGSPLSLHPEMPPMRVVSFEPGRWIVAHAPADPATRAEGRPWIDASWSFHVEALGEARCRVISRYRVSTSDDVQSLLSYGPALLEPIGFAMDRRMLLGIKQRVERSAKRRPLRSFARRGDDKRNAERRSP